MRVLVVEDEVRLAAGIEAGLEADGFAVDVTYDGTDGLWRAREQAYDAIVLDLMLPGDERVQGVRDAAPGRGVVADPGAHREGRRVGRDRGARHGRRRLPHEAVLARGARGAAAGAHATRPPERPVALVAGDLRVDPAERRVWLGVHWTSDVVASLCLSFVALSAVETWLSGERFDGIAVAEGEVAVGSEEIAEAALGLGTSTTGTVRDMCQRRGQTTLP